MKTAVCARVLVRTVGVFTYVAMVSYLVDAVSDSLCMYVNFIDLY